MSNARSVPGLDYSTVDGLQRKRLLAFVNHFLSKTVDSLSTFAQACDTKLIAISSKIRKLENSLLLLEIKLDSVPELRQIGLAPEPRDEESDTGPQEEDTDAPVSAEPAPRPTSSNRDNPVFAPFFKMMELGVPKEAVKLKMRLEGHDASVLDQK